MAHHWLIESLDLYITIETWIISKKYYVKGKASITTTSTIMKNCTTSRPTSPTCSRQDKNIWTPHSIVHRKLPCSFSLWTLLARTSTISNSTISLAIHWNRQKTILSLLPGDFNSRKMQVYTANKKISRKKCNPSKRKIYKTMSLLRRLEKQKKSKNPKTPKDSKTCQSASTKLSSKECIQPISKSPKTSSTRSVEMQKMATEICLDMNSTKKPERTNTILKEESMMH